MSKRKKTREFNAAKDQSTKANEQTSRASLKSFGVSRPGRDTETTAKPADLWDLATDEARKESAVDSDALPESHSEAVETSPVIEPAPQVADAQPPAPAKSGSMIDWNEPPAESEPVEEKTATGSKSKKKNKRQSVLQQITGQAVPVPQQPAVERPNVEFETPARRLSKTEMLEIPNFAALHNAQIEILAQEQSAAARKVAEEPAEPDEEVWVPVVGWKPPPRKDTKENTPPTEPPAAQFTESISGDIQSSTQEVSVPFVQSTEPEQDSESEAITPEFRSEPVASPFPLEEFQLEQEPAFQAEAIPSLLPSEPAFQSEQETAFQPESIAPTSPSEAAASEPAGSRRSQDPEADPPSYWAAPPPAKVTQGDQAPPAKVTQADQAPATQSEANSPSYWAAPTFHTESTAPKIQPEPAPVIRSEPQEPGAPTFPSEPQAFPLEPSAPAFPNEQQAFLSEPSTPAFPNEQQAFLSEPSAPAFPNEQQAFLSEPSASAFPTEPQAVSEPSAPTFHSEPRAFLCEPNPATFNSEQQAFQSEQSAPAFQSESPAFQSGPSEPAFQTQPQGFLSESSTPFQSAPFFQSETSASPESRPVADFVPASAPAEKPIRRTIVQEFDLSKLVKETERKTQEVMKLEPAPEFDSAMHFFTASAERMTYTAELRFRANYTPAEKKEVASAPPPEASWNHLKDETASGDNDNLGFKFLNDFVPPRQELPVSQSAGFNMLDLIDEGYRTVQPNPTFSQTRGPGKVEVAVDWVNSNGRLPPSSRDGLAGGTLGGATKAPSGQFKKNWLKK